MKKVQSIIKIFIIIMACFFAMLLFASCAESTPTPLTLDEYKEAAKAEIEAYARAKGTRQEFTADEWEDMQEYVLSAKADIDDDFDEVHVDLNVGFAKDELDHYYYTIAGLAAFKESAKIELEAMFENYKIEGRIAIEDWDEALQEVTDSKTAIDAAERGKIAYTAFSDTKRHLDRYTYYFGNAITSNKGLIKVHAYEIQKNIYTAEDWNTITAIVKQGETAINAAAGYGDIEAAKTTAIAAMDAVEITVPIEENLYNTIKQDYNEEYGEEFWFSRFYGFHNGAAVFFILGMENIEKAVIVSGVEFSFYNSDWTILVYKDGLFYDLEDISAIFDAGVLSQVDLAAIGEVNARPESEWPNGLGSYEGLSIEDELSIKKGFSNNSVTKEYVRYDSFDYYYGEYDGYVIFSRFPPYGSSWGMGYVVYDLVFSLPEIYGNMHIRKDGGYSDLDLKGLYDNGIITREELEEIYLQYLDYYQDKNFGLSYPSLG